MPKWSHYLDDDFEDESRNFEKFKPRNKQRVDEDKKPEKRKQPVNPDKK